MRIAFIVVACAFILFASFLIPLCSASPEGDARSAIVVANERVTACYIGVAEADKAGANVTDLLSTLDIAGMLLSEADLAFQKGDFESAYDLAVQSNAKLDGFDSEAISRKDAARQNGFIDFMVSVVGSSAGAVAVVVGSVVVWFWLNRRYSEVRNVESDGSSRV